MYAVILAGGTGTRLWPRSRRGSPKQLIDLTLEGRTMLQETAARLEPLVPPDRVYVVTGERYIETTRRQLPALPQTNFICEPEGRGSAPAIGLAAMRLRRRDPDAVMACLPADHHITEPERFRQALSVADQVAQQGHLVTLGIEPAYANTGYGYIEIGERLTDIGAHSVYRVRRFTEKPDGPSAEKFVAGGRHFWNSGMFIWRASAIWEEIRRHLPQLHACLWEAEQTGEREQEEDVLKTHWPQVECETIDFGVMEKAEDVVAIPVDMGWSDVGSWASLIELLPSDGDGNVILGRHKGLEARNSLIYSPRRLVATVGVENLIVVDTEDAILICSVDQAQKVKDLVDRLDQDGWQEWL